MNILLFSPFRSHPQDKGNSKRIFNFGKFLQQQNNKIHFVFYNMSDGIDANAYQCMQKCWYSFTYIPNDISFNPNGLKKTFALDDGYNKSIGPIIRKVCINYNIDIVICNYIFQSKLLEFVPNNILKIIDTHDKYTNRNEMFIKKHYWFSYTQEDEAKALNRADIIIAIQNIEKKFFETITNKKVVTVPHLETSKFIPKRYKSLLKIGFIGMTNFINSSGLLNFIDRFEKSGINAQLVIGGMICNIIKYNRFSIHRNNKIIKKGYIKNLNSFYNEVDLVINPQLFGSGLKIKTVEALAYGVPILSTKVGFVGIESKIKFHQANDTNEMISLLRILKNNPNKLNELANESKRIFSIYEPSVFKKINALFSNLKI